MTWEVIEGHGTVDVTETGIYIDGEFLPDKTTTEGVTHD